MAEKARTRQVLDADDIARSLKRIAHEILERNRGAENLVLLGIPTRGVPLAHRLRDALAEAGGADVPAGSLDVTMYRDDLRAQPIRVLQPTDIPAGGIDGAVVVLVDDVFYSGRTVRTSAGPRRCSSPSSSTAGTANSPSARTTSARTCRLRARRGSASPSSPKTAPTP